MRQITEQIVSAFLRGEAKKIDNSETYGGALYLFRNKIAEFRDGRLWITNAGWDSKTTKERLNGLPNVSIQQKRGTWYLNGVEWGGEWVDVNYWNEYSSAIPTDEIEFNVTSEWTGKFSKPVYSVFHTNKEDELGRVEELLRGAGIPSKRMESDTVGVYSPNHFLVVLPDDVYRAKRLTDEL